MDYPTGKSLPEPWGTWIPTRSPQFKIHDRISTAKSALSYHSKTEQQGTGEYATVFSGGVLYRYCGDQWVVCEVVHPGTTREQYPLWTKPKQWLKAPGITSVITENPFT